MGLKGNPNSKGPAKGLDAYKGPLGLYRKKETWSTINKMLRATDLEGKPFFTQEEQQAVANLNTGLNAYALAKTFRRIKRQYEARKEQHLKRFIA